MPRGIHELRRMDDRVGMPDSRMIFPGLPWPACSRCRAAGRRRRWKARWMLYAGRLLRCHQLRPDVSKNSKHGLVIERRRVCEVDNDGGPGQRLGETFTVIVLTPVFGAAAMTSWPCLRRRSAVFEPIRPVPPIMTIFMSFSRGGTLSVPRCSWCRGWSQGLVQVDPDLGSVAEPEPPEPIVGQ